MQLIHIVALHKLIQHCKAIVLQLNFFFKIQLLLKLKSYFSVEEGHLPDTAPKYVTLKKKKKAALF